MSAVEARTDTCSWVAKGVPIVDAEYGNYYHSTIFNMVGFRWNFEFRSNWMNKGFAVMVVRLLDLSPKISQITVQTVDTLQETNTIVMRTRKFDKEHMNWAWPDNQLSSNTIKSISEFTINTKITLISVYDSDGNDITEKYQTQKIGAGLVEQKSQTQSADNDDKFKMYDVRLDSMTTQIQEMMKSIKTIQNTLKDIQLQMNEEQKNNNNDLKKEMDEMKKNIKILLSNNNNNNMDKDKKEFKNWIEIKLKLPEYYDVFIENGIETLNVVQLMTKDELNEIGITKVGHRMQIMKEIQILQQKSNDQPAEGGTAYI